jgi:hypothetical protein
MTDTTPNDVDRQRAKVVDRYSGLGPWPPRRCPAPGCGTGMQMRAPGRTRELQKQTSRSAQSPSPGDRLPLGRDGVQPPSTAWAMPSNNAGQPAARNNAEQSSRARWTVLTQASASGLASTFPDGGARRCAATMSQRCLVPGSYGVVVFVADGDALRAHGLGMLARTAL